MTRLREFLDVDGARLRQVSRSALARRPWSSCVSQRFAPDWLAGCRPYIAFALLPRTAKILSLSSYSELLNHVEPLPSGRLFIAHL